MCYNNQAQNLAELCNGSTADSDSVCWGSNPYSAAKIKNRPLWSVLYFERALRYDPPTYFRKSLPSPTAKLADCAYRRWRYIAMRGDVTL